MSVCQRCGRELPAPKPPSPPRKWCSERCRKRQYDRECVDCGCRIDGTTPGRSGDRCRHCSNVVSGAQRKAWTREAIIAAIREYAVRYGQPPTQTDRSPTHATALGLGDRVERLRADGCWPTFMSVVREFGSWNAGIAVAGFEPRPAHHLPRQRAAA